MNDYPPEFDYPDHCLICNRNAAKCCCPECKECGEQGNPDCVNVHMQWAKWPAFQEKFDIFVPFPEGVRWVYKSPDMWFLYELDNCIAVLVSHQRKSEKIIGLPSRPPMFTNRPIAS